MNALMGVWAKLGKRGKVAVIFGCVVVTILVIDWLGG